MYGELVKPQGRGSIPLEKSHIVVGTAPSCDLILSGSSAAPRHCLLVARNRRWYVKRLSDAGAVTVNGVEVTELALYPGDRIGLGRLELVIQYHPTALAALRATPNQQQGPTTRASTTVTAPPEEEPRRQWSALHKNRKVQIIAAGLVVLAVLVGGLVIATAPTDLERAREEIALGQAHMQARRWGAALRSLEKAESLLAPDAVEHDEIWNHRRDLYVATNQYEKAARIELSNDHQDEALRLFRKAEAWGEVADIHSEAGRHKEAGDAYSKAEDWQAAAKEYEQTEEKTLLALAYEKAMLWRKAAEAYESLGDKSRAAMHYATAGEWRRAADLAPMDDPARRAEYYAKAGEIDPGVEVRLQAARSFVAAGDKARARQQFHAAADLARHYRNYQDVLSIYEEMGAPKDGLRIVVQMAKEAAHEKETGEAFEAYAAAGRWMRDRGARNKVFDSKLLSDILGRLGELKTELESYPSIIEINGVNNYTQYGTRSSIFSNTKVHGSLRNSTAHHIEEVSIRIKLFRKDRDGFSRSSPSAETQGEGAAGQGEAWRQDGSDVDPDKEQAGHVEVIVVRDIAPGDWKSFEKTLSNTVPYKMFMYPLFGLKTRKP